MSLFPLLLTSDFPLPFRLPWESTRTSNWCKIHSPLLKICSATPGHCTSLWSPNLEQCPLHFSRDIYIEKTGPEFELGSDQCLQVLRPLYGLCDAENLWHQSLDEHHWKELSITPFRVDPALYPSSANNTLTGLSGTYADDSPRTGTDSFRRHCRRTNENFEMTDEYFLPA